MHNPRPQSHSHARPRTGKQAHVCKLDHCQHAQTRASKLGKLSKPVAKKTGRICCVNAVTICLIGVLTLMLQQFSYSLQVTKKVCKCKKIVILQLQNNHVKMAHVNSKQIIICDQSNLIIKNDTQGHKNRIIKIQYRIRGSLLDTSGDKCECKIWLT